MATEPWYESSLAISAVEVALGILAIIVTFGVTLYAARPRQWLQYRLRSVREVSDFDSCDLRDAAVGLGHPRILEIRIRSRGRRDIPSAAFDTGKPVLFRVGGLVVEMLGEPLSWPKERLIPRARVMDGALAIGPGLICKNQALVYRVLADVAEPELTVFSSLIDVRLWMLPSPGEVIRNLLLGGWLCIISLAGGVTLIGFYDRPGNRHFPGLVNWLVSSALGMTIWFSLVWTASEKISDFYNISIDPCDQTKTPLNPWEWWRGLR